MKVSKFSRNKNRTNDRKDSTKQAKHFILNAVPQIRTKKKVMINIYIYIYIYYMYTCILHIYYIYIKIQTHILYIYTIWILLSYWSYFQSLMSADTSSSTHSIYVTHEHLSTFTCLILLLLTNILCFPSTCKKNWLSIISTKINTN